MMFLSILAVLIACPFVLYELAKSDNPMFFTTMESGDIRFIMKGKTLHRMIHDVRGKKWSDGKGKSFSAELVNLLPNESDGKGKLARWFGLYWIGLYPFYSVLKFKIKKTRENTAGTKPQDWITKVEEEEVTTFRHTFPLPFVLTGVEIKDRTKVDLMAVGTFEVVRPYIPVIKLKGDYYTRMSSRLLAATSDELKAFESFLDFVAAPKKEADGILAQALLKDPLSTFNDDLIANVGLKLTEISIPQYSADEAILAATQKEAVAKLEGAALLAAAEFYKQKLAKETEADAARIDALGIARGGQITKVVTAMGTLEGSPDVATRGAADLLEMEAATGEHSKLTMVIKGGQTPQIVIPGGKP